MTATPYDDPIAFDRRWGHVDPSALSALVDADPLLFLADHIPCADRREGCVAIGVGLHHGQSPLITVPDGPADPTDVQCLALLGSALERSGDQVKSMGVIHHRRGGVGIVDVDRRWALALKAVCEAFSIEPSGVMARLYTGQIVRVPIPEVIPDDYFEAMKL